MKIYTRTGDDGSTGLPGGARVPKSDPLMECCGSLDELNAAIGLAAVVAPPTMLDQLRQIQHDLLLIGSHVAAIGGPPCPAPPLDRSCVSGLEKQIDAAEAELPPLKQFILPGGSELAARLHFARTICRRAERAMVAISAAHERSSVILAYINRLSDLLFVLARLANHLAGVHDVPWRKPQT